MRRSDNFNWRFQIIDTKMLLDIQEAHQPEWTLMQPHFAHQTQQLQPTSAILHITNAVSNPLPPWARLCVLWHFSAIIIIVYLARTWTLNVVHVLIQITHWAAPETSRFGKNWMWIFDANFQKSSLGKSEYFILCEATDRYAGIDCRFARGEQQNVMLTFLLLNVFHSFSQLLWNNNNLSPFVFIIVLSVSDIWLSPSSLLCLFVLCESH